MSKKLLKITNTNNIDYDSKNKFQFHVTVAMKDIDRKFTNIWNYLKNYEIKSKNVCYRITLLKKGKIICEYELPTKRLFHHKQPTGRRRLNFYH